MWREMGRYVKLAATPFRKRREAALRADLRNGPLRMNSVVLDSHSLGRLARGPLARKRQPCRAAAPSQRGAQSESAP